MMAESSRLFFSIWPDKNTQEKAAVLAESFRRTYGGRAIHKESLHITLAFLGETPNSQIPKLIELANQIISPTFRLTLSKAGYFNKGIFWLGPAESPSELLTLVTNLRQLLITFNIAFDKKEFVPHMTLLRNTVCGETPKKMIEPINFFVKSFVLATSIPNTKASRYKVIAEFPLKD